MLWIVVHLLDGSGLGHPSSDTTRDRADIYINIYNTGPIVELHAKVSLLHILEVFQVGFGLQHICYILY